MVVLCCVVIVCIEQHALRIQRQLVPGLSLDFLQFHIDLGACCRDCALAGVNRLDEEGWYVCVVV